MTASSDLVERVARALYAASCAVEVLEPDWGRGGYKTAVIYWEALARAALKTADFIQQQPARIAALEADKAALVEENKALKTAKLSLRSHLEIVPMLMGPKAWQLWSRWIEPKTWMPLALNRHFSWGPKARPGEGEDIATVLLKVEDDIATGKCKSLDFEDATLAKHGGGNG